MMVLELLDKHNLSTFSKWKHSCLSNEAYDIFHLQYSVKIMESFLDEVNVTFTSFVTVTLLYYYDTQKVNYCSGLLCNRLCNNIDCQ